MFFPFSRSTVILPHCSVDFNPVTPVDLTLNHLSSPMLIYLMWEISKAWQIDPIKEHLTLCQSEAIKMCTSGAVGRNMQALLYPVHCHAIYSP